MPDDDNITKEKTIYQVSPWEIFWRNFLAGMARALGGVILYALVLTILSNIFLRFFWPQIEPLVDTLNTSTEILKNFQSIAPGERI